MSCISFGLGITEGGGDLNLSELSQQMADMQVVVEANAANLATIDTKVQSIDEQEFANAVWNTTSADVKANGSVGKTLKDILQSTLGGTAVDFENNTLTIFEEDGTTPLKTFKLYDRTGNPSTSFVFSKEPT